MITDVIPTPVQLPPPSKSVARRVEIQKQPRTEPVQVATVVPPPGPHIVLVTGGRDWAKSEARKRWIARTLTALEPRPDLLVVGGDNKTYPNGVDGTAYQWALDTGVQPAVCPANWGRFFNAAGPIRNGAMLKLRPTLVVAFPGGSGTRDMVRRAHAAGVPVQQIEEDPDVSALG